MGLIRLFLALSVVIWHVPGASFHFLNGAVAVVLFFIISGFYMAMVINEKYAKTDGEHWIGTFYLARFWRLYPTYFVMLLLYIAWFIPTDNPNPLVMRLPIPAFEQVLLIFSNVFVVGQDIHQFLVRVFVERAAPPALLGFVDHLGPHVLYDMGMAIGQAWSISMEVFFYALVPFFVRSWRKTALFLSIALAVRIVLIGVLHQRSGIWGYYFFPGSICFFLMGSMAYHLKRMIPAASWHLPVGKTILLVAATAVVWGTIRQHGLMMPPVDASLDPPRFWLLYVLFTLSMPFIFEATKTSAIDRAIGDLSYPLYITHGLIIGFAYYRWTAPRGVVPDAWATVVLCLIAAYTMHHLVEIPFERYRHRFLRRKHIR
jgi:peptidoglycan/LPS O-acetylase OafA/YrhL